MGNIAEDIIIKSNSTWGYELEGGFENMEFVDEWGGPCWDEVEKFLDNRGFDLHGDCSVCTGAVFDHAEIVLDGWRRDYNVLDSVGELMEVCNELEFVSNNSCGIHIHVGKEGDGWQAGPMLRLMYLIAQVEPLIFEMLPLSRRGNDYCCYMNKPLVDELLKLDPATMDALLFAGGTPVRMVRNIISNLWNRYSGGRYWGLNMSSYWHQGTIEFRYFDADELMLAHYIDLVDKLICFAQENNFSRIREFAHMLSEKESKREQLSFLLSTIQVAESTKQRLEILEIGGSCVSDIPVSLRVPVMQGQALQVAQAWA